MSELEKWEQTLKELREETGDRDAARAAAEEAFQKRLEKAIDKRIRKICLKTIAVVLVVLAVVFLGISPLMYLICPSPRHPSRSSDLSLDAYLSAYYETVRPYAEVVPVATRTGGDEDAARRIYKSCVAYRGFGCYTMKLDVVDRSVDGWAHLGAGNVKVEYNWGQYRVVDDPGGNLIGVMPQFSYTRSPEEVSEVVEGLPRSTAVYLNIRASGPVTLEEIRGSGVTPLWIEVYNDTSLWRGGLSLINAAGGLDSTEWRENLNDAQLREIYLDHLDTILSIPRLLEQLPIYQEMEEDTIEGYSGGMWYAGVLSSKQEYIQEARDAVAAQEGPLMTERYCICGSRDEVLEFLKTADIRWADIQNIYLYDGSNMMW